MLNMGKRGRPAGKVPASKRVVKLRRRHERAKLDEKRKQPAQKALQTSEGESKVDQSVSELITPTTCPKDDFSHKKSDPTKLLVSDEYSEVCDVQSQEAQPDTVVNVSLGSSELERMDIPTQVQIALEQKVAGDCSESFLNESPLKLMHHVKDSECEEITVHVVGEGISNARVSTISETVPDEGISSYTVVWLTEKMREANFTVSSMHGCRKKNGTSS